MTTIDHQKPIKVRIFRFLQLSWTQILTGQLYLNSQQQNLKISYQNTTNDHLIPNCTPNIQKNDKKYIEINYNRLSKIQQEQSDRKIVYIWIDVNPFSFSFLNEHKATQVCNILQLMQQNLQIVQQSEITDIVTEQYVNNIIQTNLAMATTLFINSNDKVLNIIMKTTNQVINKQQISQQLKQNYFTLFKNAMRIGDRRVLQKFLQDQNYSNVLTIFSWNPFNAIPFNYLSQYNKLIHIDNPINITDSKILQPYKLNAKIRYLRDVVTCVFIQPQNQRILQNIINSNNHILLSQIICSDQILNLFTQLSQKQPILYINIFIQIWQIFKIANFDYGTQIIKQVFVQQFCYKNLHNCSLTAINKILTNQYLHNKVTPRLYQKWIQAFNPFLNYNWKISYTWLSTQIAQNISLITLLYKLLQKCNDYSLIQTVFTFIKNIIQPCQGRLQIQPKLLCYIFNQFIGKIWICINQKISNIEIYIDFIIKCYKIDYVRTRRILIQNKIILSLNKRIQNKNILICIIKLLHNFLDDKPTNRDIFKYLISNKLFKGIRQQYDRNISILMRKINDTESQQARKYFQFVFLKKQLETQ